MDSVHGHLGPGGRAPRSSAATTSRRASRETVTGVGSDRTHGHLRVVVGDGDLLVRAAVTRRLGTAERIGDATGPAGRLRAAGRQRSGGEEPKELGPPQLDSAKSVSDWHQDRGLGQPGQRETVPTGPRPGNRDRVRNAASPATPFGGTGDVNRSSRRLTPDIRSVVDLSTRRPGRRVGESRRADRGSFVFRPSPTTTPEIRSHDRAQRDVGSEFPSAAARRTTWARSSRTSSTVGPGKNATSSAPASTSASA